MLDRYYRGLASSLRPSHSRDGIVAWLAFSVGADAGAPSVTRPARGYVRRQSVVRDEPPPDRPSTERPLRIILEPSARKKELAHAARQGASASGHVTVGRIWAAAGSDGALHEAHGGIGQREGRAAQVEPKHCDGAEARSIDGLAGKARAARDGLRR